ncbi:MAG: hypothetical protein HDS64_11420 [Bacteroidales bacterium]|nr:hypothetical protein [Bacteroidales bacterium]
MEEQNQEINQPVADETPVEGTPVNGDKPSETPEKTSYWVMGIFMVLFLVCGGISYCPWWMWIVIAVLVFGTIGGFNKKTQAVLGIVILIWGTPIFGDDDSSDFNSSSQSTYTSGGSGSSGGHAQTEAERRAIEADFYTLEQMQQRFENAYNRHDMDAAKRISDEAMDYKRHMEQKNLTQEQRRRLQAMF